MIKSVSFSQAIAMNAPHLITLLTDFGDRDTYVGVMKGVIAQIAPETKVIDLTHQIPPQDILAGRFHLLSASPYFPSHAVHVAVVDPGVGTARQAIAVQCEIGIFVAPDNGLLSGILECYAVQQAIALDNPNYWRTTIPSHTFHGRDIFAAVGAHLSQKTPLSKIGSSIQPDMLVKIDLPPVRATPAGFCGCIQHIDHFGNLITTIPNDIVQSESWWIHCQNQQIPGSLTYDERPPGELLALKGSHGWLEIAVCQGRASEHLMLQRRDEIYFNQE